MKGKQPIPPGRRERDISAAQAGDAAKQTKIQSGADIGNGKAPGENGHVHRGDAGEKEIIFLIHGSATFQRFLTW